MCIQYQLYLTPMSSKFQNWHQSGWFVKLNNSNNNKKNKNIKTLRWNITLSIKYSLLVSLPFFPISRFILFYFNFLFVCIFFYLIFNWKCSLHFLGSRNKTRRARGMKERDRGRIHAVLPSITFFFIGWTRFPAQ